MKVLLINGSPHEKGCTYTALNEVVKGLKEEGIETEILHLGNKPIQSCTACGKCYDKSGKCAFNDVVNVALEKAQTVDGFVFGSAVHYAGATGAITAFLDRFFYAGKGFSFKPGAAVVSARRGGTTAALDQLNKYFALASMPVVSSQYWNMVHGMTPEDTAQDLEGMQVMRVLGRNMGWLIKSIAAGKAAGVNKPKREEGRARTNFIR